MKSLLSILLVMSLPLFANEGLFRDLMTIDYLNTHCGSKELPVTYNHLLYGGYLNMPSARMGCAGEVGAGYAWVSPYHLYNLRFQLLNHVEISANYRVYSHIPDPILSDRGFGNFSDKGANLKIALLHPHESGFRLPGIALGLEDFIGTRAFISRYIVFTQVLPKLNLELTLGYGDKRIRGFFGGAALFPFSEEWNPYIRPISLVAEYDATPYHDEKREPHPDGRNQRSKWNVGLKYRLYDTCDLSLSYVRGEKVAFSLSTFYNFGNTTGFVPKIKDHLPYTAPCNREPLGEWRSENMLIHDLIHPFGAQGFTLMQVWLSYSAYNERILRLVVYNRKYRNCDVVQQRIATLLRNLIPSNIDFVRVTLEGEGMPLYDMEFCMDFLRDHCKENQLPIVFPLKDASRPNPLMEGELFSQTHQRIALIVMPKTRFLFGSSKGKFKYAAGGQAGLFGILPYDLYYTIRLGWLPLTSLYNLKDSDRLNPSRLPNVRTDSIRYYQQEGITLDEAYIQKNLNIGGGCYSKIAFGYFESAYGGAAAEFLYYPLHSCVAFGVEGAVVRKRSYSGIGFSDKVRILKGPREDLIPTYRHFLGSQCFASLYFSLDDYALDFKVKGGKFLADDYGARFELTRYFPSGFRVTFWYTRTNGHDIVNNATYYDKGISFSMPLDCLTLSSKKERFGYGMSAWLRDVGAFSATGKSLYHLLHDERC